MLWPHFELLNTGGVFFKAKASASVKDVRDLVVFDTDMSEISSFGLELPLRTLAAATKRLLESFVKTVKITIEKRKEVEDFLIRWRILL